MQNLMKRIQNREATVGIIGLGYVGLPLAQAFRRAGFNVVGFDIDPQKIDALMAGRSYFKHISHKSIAEMKPGQGFEATTDFSKIANVDAILICVPTPLTKTRDPDMSFIVGTAETISPHLKKGHVVVLESTTYPGTTRDVLRPILENSGLKAGTDFYLAFSPEREDPANPDFTTHTIAKVVGGFDPASRDLAAALYGACIERVVPVSSCEVAEACKLTENIYRAVNIALVNELKVIYSAMGIDVWEVLDSATPNERYSGKRPANRTPRWEPREKWPRGSPCAKPQTLVKGKPGVRLKLAVTFEGGRRHLPVVALRRVA